MSKPNKTFLKWAGNKSRCIEKILAHLPAGRRLIEPFTGSGAVFLHSSYSSYILAEENQDLVNLYQVLQSEGLGFIHYSQELFSPKTNLAEYYYARREEFNFCQEKRRRAALFLYLNRHGYNGLCRYNNQGFYNVPFGSHERPYFPRQQMLDFHLKSQKAAFLQQDFRLSFAMAEAGDVIYCDPPYVPLSNTASFTSYTEQGFSLEDQRDLAELAFKAASQGCLVLISNHDTDFTRECYQGAKLYSFPVQRWISCNAYKRLAVQELLAVFEPEN